METVELNENAHSTGKEDMSNEKKATYDTAHDRSHNIETSQGVVGPQKILLWKVEIRNSIIRQ